MKVQGERSDLLAIILKDERMAEEEGELITFFQAKSHKSNKRNEKIKVIPNGLNFGGKNIMVSMAILGILYIVVELIIYILLALRGRQVTQFIKLYSNSVDYWISFTTLHSIVMNLLTWNGKAKFWERHPLEAYSKVKARIENIIVPTFEESVYYNLGNYTTTHLNKMLDVISI